MPERPNPLTDDVLDRYFAGELDPEQAAAVRVYLDANPGRRGYVAGLHGSLRSAARGTMPTVEPSWQRLVAKLGALTPSQHVPLSRNVGSVERLPRMAPRSSHFPWWIGGALFAGVALALLVSWPIMSRPPVTSSHVYTTTAGQRATVTLDDGTQVTLAPRTTLRVAAFDARARVVSLDGEAYFIVTHTSPAPFTVRTGAVHTRVLGTAFDVRHYPTDAEVQVAVTQGKVTVHGRTPSQVVTLAAGRVARVTDSTLITAVVGDVRDYASWTTGRLVFRGTQVADMLTTVGAWYGYEFHLADSTLARMRVNADLQFSSSAVMFKALENLLGVQMKFDGHVVTLHPRQTPRQAPRTTRDLERSLSTSLEFGK